jgi:hypothetical protein
MPASERRRLALERGGQRHVPAVEPAEEGDYRHDLDDGVLRVVLAQLRKVRVGDGRRACTRRPRKLERRALRRREKRARPEPRQGPHFLERDARDVRRVLGIVRGAIGIAARTADDMRDHELQRFRHLALIHHDRAVERPVGPEYAGPAHHGEPAVGRVALGLLPALHHVRDLRELFRCRRGDARHGFSTPG